MKWPFVARKARHWMRRADDAIDRNAFERREPELHSIAAKKNEHDLATRVTEATQNSTRERFPGCEVGARCVLHDGERSVEEEDAFVCPLGEVALNGTGERDLRITLQVQEYAMKRGVFRDRAPLGEREPVRAPSSVVRVLTEKNNPHLLVRRRAEGSKNAIARRKDPFR